MHDDLIQKISLFLDDELPQDEALSLLQKLRIHSELADKMRRYEAVSHAIKNDDVLVAAKPEFVSSVSGQIQLEPTYLIPNAERRFLRQRSFSRPQKIAAAAASVAIIAFIAHMQRNESGNNDKVVVAAIKPTDNQSPKPETSKAINRQINDYLQVHNSMYANGHADFPPYAQVTRYSQK